MDGPWKFGDVFQCRERLMGDCYPQDESEQAVRGVMSFSAANG